MASGKSGDPEANDWSSQPRLDRLFAANLPYVHAFVRLHVDPLTRSRESVSDIVQSACREVLANERFEIRDELAFRSYLCQAALFKLQNRRRHYGARKRRTTAEQPLPSESSLAKVYCTTILDPGRRIVLDEEVAQLEAAFDRLPDDYRQALTLVRIAGVPLPELARRLGRTEGAARMLLSRAMARLTTLMRPQKD